MQAAKQMCACFVEAVRPYAQGMISRYDDTYEPRAFGDGIQSLGVSTMLVEAGGWIDSDPEPLTRLHFHGMLATLHAIATDKYRAADAQIYEDLPNSNSTRANDCFVSKANVLDAKVPEPFVADFLIDQSHSERLAVTPLRDGKVIEIGDLPSVAARLVVNAANQLVLPGQIVLASDWKPGTSLSEERIAELLAHGATTVVGVVDLGDSAAVEAIAAPQTLPFNRAFIGNADSLRQLKGSELVERIAVAAAHGLLAVVSGGVDETLWREVNQFGLPLVKPGQLVENVSGSYSNAAKLAWNSANALKLEARRGRINRGYLADLLFFDDMPSAGVKQATDWKKLSRVMVAGETVWENGKRSGGAPGILLRHCEFD
jgi:hypothetical protein